PAVCASSASSSSESSAGSGGRLPRTCRAISSARLESEFVGVLMGWVPFLGHLTLVLRQKCLDRFGSAGSVRLLALPLATRRAVQRWQNAKVRLHRLKISRLGVCNIITQRAKHRLLRQRPRL